MENLYELSKEELIEKIEKLEERNSKIFNENLHLYLFLQTCASQVSIAISYVERDYPFPYLVEKNPAFNEYMESIMCK